MSAETSESVSANQTAERAVRNEWIFINLSSVSYSDCEDTCLLQTVTRWRVADCSTAAVALSVQYVRADRRWIDLAGMRM
jgi:hypothetical protein